MKTAIKKSELKKIYDIACATWQPKIEKYAQRNPFSDEVEFSEKEIKEMISASTLEQVSTVKEVFNITNSWEDIKTVEDAIERLGEKDEDVVALRQLYKIDLPRYIVAKQELVLIIKAVNGQWVADYNNSRQPKWYNWWYLGKDFRLGGSILALVVLMFRPALF